MLKRGEITEVSSSVSTSGGSRKVICLSVFVGQDLLECFLACWGLPFVYSTHDLKEAVSALIYTLTAKDIKIWANIQLTLLQINLETALGKFDSIKRFCQFVWEQFLFCSASSVTLHAIVLI